MEREVGDALVKVLVYGGGLACVIIAGARILYWLICPRQFRTRLVWRREDDATGAPLDTDS